MRGSISTLTAHSCQKQTEPVRANSESSLAMRMNATNYDATVGPIPRHLERAEAVARFRLTTGHDFWGVCLHWLGVAANEVHTLCGHSRIDGDHLLQCSGLDEYRLMTLSVGTRRIGVKWSRSQARALDTGFVR
ncbi:reverse transcriptase [Trichonephila clavipes]|nr:reverse transcriptase [Trichonephila clavipes]